MSIGVVGIAYNVMKSFMFNADSKVYESPEISTINVTIEKGFAQSSNNENLGDGIVIPGD